MKKQDFINLIKTATREVIKEELSSIIKEVMKGTASVIAEASNTSMHSRTPPVPARNPTSVKDRVFQNGDDDFVKPKVTEAAQRIGSGNFNLSDLQEMVGTDHPEDPDFEGLNTDSLINDLISKGRLGP